MAKTDDPALLSALAFVEASLPRWRHAEAVAECSRCNVGYIVAWARKQLLPTIEEVGSARPGQEQHEGTRQPKESVLAAPRADQVPEAAHDVLAGERVLDLQSVSHNLRANEAEVGGVAGLLVPERDAALAAQLALLAQIAQTLDVRDAKGIALRAWEMSEADLRRVVVKLREHLLLAGPPHD